MYDRAGAERIAAGGTLRVAESPKSAVEKYGLRIRALLFFAAFVFNAAPAHTQTSEQGYQLLLSPQRVRRLRRDRERNTQRWVNFEKRVQSVPDSAERGFELALYFAVTRDEARGREAIQWAMAHPCLSRQIALITDWVSELIPAEQRSKILHGSLCTGLMQDSEISVARDALFMTVAEGKEVRENDWRPLLPHLETDVLKSSPELYALCEYLIAVRSSTHIDLRQDDAKFFRLLPNEFLLSLKPSQIERPQWVTHIAALAMVAVDPNLAGSQFVQGWAMEDNQLLVDGPGVAYEFLWADPYLPGIAYRNLDPWAYDPAGRLFARTDWDPGSCWLAVDAAGVRKENCPADVLDKKQSFGTLTLLPVSAQCIDIPVRGNREDLILWRMKPRQALAYRGEGKKDLVETADAAGMWLVPENAKDKVCQVRAAKR